MNVTLYILNNLNIKIVYDLKKLYLMIKILKHD